MRRRRPTLRGALVAALLGTGAGTAEAEPSPPASPPAAERSAAGEPLAGEAAAVRTLGLVTGDTVTSSGGRIAVRPREGVRFLRYRDGEHQYVVPSDAVPLLRADRLDRRLFDVNGLLAGGYDRLPALPLIVSDASGASVARGLRVGRRLAAIDGFAAEVPGP
ncbi:hypothetical protein [Streptosporangium sp. V21-05]|uniref:hypothetical protein n=1 Tax=Streptosporangium sp. V21-05 TaxID=3446115 RepID=UPI003F529936